MQIVRMTSTSLRRYLACCCCCCCSCCHCVASGKHHTHTKTNQSTGNCRWHLLYRYSDGAISLCKCLFMQAKGLRSCVILCVCVCASVCDAYLVINYTSFFSVSSSSFSSSQSNINQIRTNRYWLLPINFC